MIDFACYHCGLKLQVKDEFAGKAAKCPTCKKLMKIPQLDQTVAQAPPRESILGHPSGLSRSRLGGGATGETTVAIDLREPARPRTGVGGPRRRSVREILASAKPGDERYVVEEEIARGGMGIVLRAVDRDIRREVAVKYLLNQADAAKTARFVEEAQITGQLEHPSIVPIHELAADAGGRLFFAMKMVKGKTLAQVLIGLRGERGTSIARYEKDYSLGRLLAAFVNICNALAYAHSRNVIHRDLKPANLMVGDFGEVYLMDWGLAKVLGQAVREQTIETDRDGPMTEVGTILGTPIYMPPEQAEGRVADLDQRSDVYSLGAILYEILTLQPPVDKSGGYANILRRVAMGMVVPPEERVRQVGLKRWIPPELSAIAMKALARRPEDRYQAVEPLRRDVELFLAGHSVSAKEDSARAALWKLVKRNRAVSAVTAAALVLIAIIWGRSLHASWEQAKNSVPAFVRAGQLSIRAKEFDDALTQLNFALEHEPDNAQARLWKAQILIVHHRDFAAARAELGKYLQLRPDDADALKLAELCSTATPNDLSTDAAFVDVLARYQELALVQAMGEQLVAPFRQRIEAAWPGLGSRLMLDRAGKFSLDIARCSEVQDLTPLKGIPLAALNTGGNPGIKDLDPLRGMPLTQLNIEVCSQVTQLDPIKGMKLTHLAMGGCAGVRDLAELRGMPLVFLHIQGCAQVTDLTPLEGMSLREIHFTPRNIKTGIPILRALKSLQTIGLHERVKFPAQEFWKRYEAGEFK